MPKLLQPDIDRRNKRSAAYQKAAIERFPGMLGEEHVLQIEHGWEIDVEAHACPAPSCHVLHEGELGLRIFRQENGDPCYVLYVESDDESTTCLVTARHITALIADCQEMLRLMS